MSNNIDFARNLVKKGIAETIFSQILRDTGNYAVFEFGYEKNVTEIMRQNFGRDSPVIESLRVAHDFAAIKLITKEVRLIEVKYQYRLDPKASYNVQRKYVLKPVLPFYRNIRWF